MWANEATKRTLKSDQSEHNNHSIAWSRRDLDRKHVTKKKSVHVYDAPPGEAQNEASAPGTVELAYEGDAVGRGPAAGSFHLMSAQTQRELVASFLWMTIERPTTVSTPLSTIESSE